jgi:hypothetical protein
MARPRELYSGPAPQAMSLMGQGIADAYANVGRIEGQGYAALGESIAKGITGAASAVAGYAKEQKQLESQNKSYENLFKNPLVQNMFFQDKQGPEGVITAKDQASQFLAQTADMKPSEKNMFFNTIVPPAIGQYYKMQQIEAEQKGLYDRAVATKKPSLNIGSADKAIYDVLNFQDDGFGSPSGQSQPNVQDSTAGETGLAEFLRKRGWSGRGPVPQALMDEYNASIGR